MFSITGQIYNYTESVPVDQSPPLRYNQVYFVDADKACDLREASVGDRVDSQTIRNLEAI